MGGRLKTLRYDFYKTSVVDALLAKKLDLDGSNANVTINLQAQDLVNVGKMGIGVIPGRQLQLGGTATPRLSLKSSNTTGDCILLFGDSSGDAQGRIQYKNTGDVMAFYTSNTEWMRIGITGNVGFGTTNAQRKIHILGTEPIVRMEVFSSNHYSEIVADNNGGVTFNAGADDDADDAIISWQMQSDEKMSLDGDGILSIVEDVRANRLVCSAPDNGNFAFADDNNANVLSLRKEVAGHSGFNFFTPTGTEDLENIFWSVYDAGTGSSSANNPSWITLAKLTTENFWKIRTNATGTGVLKELRFFTGDNTGQLVLKTDGNVEMSGSVTSGQTTIDHNNDGDAVDVSGVNSLMLDCSGGDVIIGAFVGGVAGQVLYLARGCTSANDVTLEHNEGTGNQNIFLHAGADETLTTEYGGWVLVCNGTSWFDTSHAKHV